MIATKTHQIEIEIPQGLDPADAAKLAGKITSEFLDTIGMPRAVVPAAPDKAPPLDASTFLDGLGELVPQDRPGIDTASGSTGWLLASLHDVTGDLRDAVYRSRAIKDEDRRELAGDLADLADIALAILVELDAAQDNAVSRSEVIGAVRRKIARTGPLSPEAGAPAVVLGNVDFKAFKAIQAINDHAERASGATETRAVRALLDLVACLTLSAEALNLNAPEPRAAR